MQRDLLDHFGGLLDDRALVATHYIEWKTLTERLDQLRTAESDRASRLDLLTFQLQELDTLAVKCGEFEELSGERQKLQNSGRLAEGVNSALGQIFDEDSGNANSLIADATRTIEHLADVDLDLGPALEMLQSANIQVSEAADALRRYADTIDMDPLRRDQVEERLDAIQALTRKHRVEPDELPALADRLRAEYDELTHADERGRELEQQAAAAIMNITTIWYATACNGGEPARI